MHRTRIVPVLFIPLLIAACSNPAAPDPAARGEIVRPARAALDAAPPPVDSTTTARGGNLMGGH